MSVTKPTIMAPYNLESFSVGEKLKALELIETAYNLLGAKIHTKGSPDTVTSGGVIDFVLSCHFEVVSLSEGGFEKIPMAEPNPSEGTLAGQLVL